MKTKLIAGFCLVLLLLFVWVLIVKFEGEKPSISIDMASPYIGKSHKIPVTVSDSKSGIKKIWIGLITEGKETVVFAKEFSPTGPFGAGKKQQATFTVAIEPASMGISDGPALLRMVASDFSWRNWGNGNRGYIEKQVTIDTTSPGINMLSRQHNVSQGGSGLVVYKLSEPCRKSGVFVGDNFFPGHLGYFRDRAIALAFFAVAYDQGPKTDIFLSATDFAGNISRSAVPHYLKRRRFKKDTVEISESFMRRKLVEFDAYQANSTAKTLIEKFLYINRNLRRANHEQIASLTDNTDNAIYWHGPFLRLPNAARKASYADDRTYTYQGKVVDRQVHLGIDLASVAHSPIPAANGGKVLFAGNLGIYGKTVMIDHGMGLFTIYGHMSTLDTKQGAMVAKGDTIGYTGSTGLAGGDHLHFGVLVHRTFVNPIEWWDGTWIKHNILSKINDIALSP
jgi:murein DD-endopeptidase MepM/ murein hydrolase activator NlpD